MHDYLIFFGPNISPFLIQPLRRTRVLKCYLQPFSLRGLNAFQSIKQRVLKMVLLRVALQVQECDARMLNRISTARTKKILINNKVCQ